MATPTLPSYPAVQRLAISNIPIGPVAYASIGTNTTDVNGQLWITDILVPYSFNCTNILVLQGGTATTDNIMVMIYDQSGAKVGNSNTAGVLLSGANTFKTIALLNGPVQLYGPARYFVAVQGNGTAAGAIQTISASTYIDVVSAAVAGTFGTVPATITVPTTFTAGQAPVVYLS